MALFENLRSLFAPNITYVYGGNMGVRVADMDAAQLYRTQPNLRAAVGFLADNAAQIPLKVHDRAGDNDRPRVTDSPAALLLRQPNPDMTPFEFKRWMYSDLLLYERFLVLVVPSADTQSGWEIRPVPNSWIAEYKGRSPFAPESVTIMTGRSAGVEVPADRFILFHGYDPNDPMRQCSRISALKETLHEQVESNAFRRQMWHRGGRFNAYLTRPKDVAPWSPEAFDRFKETWKASWAGGDAGEGGGMPILEDGMEIKTVQFNSRDAQWVESVKLAREDVAAIYRFNPALLWPGTGQTYASARDNARALYNDCLAPTLMQATDRLNMCLLPMVGEPATHYVVYDISIKTQGTMEERIGALQTACGGPFMSREEVRAIMDLPREPDGDLIVPLNVLVGGLASSHDTDPTVERYNGVAQMLDEAERILGRKSAVMPGPKAETPAPRKAAGEPSEADEQVMVDVYRAFFERQAKSVLPKIEGKSAAKADQSWWNAERWDRELADDLFAVAIEQATAAGCEAVRKLWPDDATRGYDRKRTEAFVRSMCERRAEMVNQATLAELLNALKSDNGESATVDEKGLKDTVRGVFTFASRHRALTAGLALAASVVGFGVREAANQNRRRGESVYKTWRTRSGNPRSSHKALDGETVQMDEKFSNGMEWPGDMKGGNAAEVANCKCALDVEVRGGGAGGGSRDGYHSYPADDYGAFRKDYDKREKELQKGINAKWQEFTANETEENYAATVGLYISQLSPDGRIRAEYRAKPKGKELVTGERLAANGHDVVYLSEAGPGKHPDSKMDGVKTDFKRMESDRPKKVYDRVMDAAEKADGAVVDLAWNTIGVEDAVEFAKRAIDRSHLKDGSVTILDWRGRETTI